MDIIRAILLGVIQALTEFLPISSSGHLIVFRDWLGFQSIDGLTFDVALHVGTVLALVAYFHRDIRRLLVAFVTSVRRPNLRSDVDQRLAWYIVVATIPAALAGALLDDVVENFLRNAPVIVATLTIGAVLFIIVERICRPVGDIGGLTLRACLLIGVAQSLALIPGVSRSGITIITGMTQNLRREEAARFSFLLSVPIMLGAGLKKALDLRGMNLTAHEGLVLLGGAVSAAVVGWLVIKYLLKFLQSHTLNVFAYYRLLLAAVILIWLLR